MTVVPLIITPDAVRKSEAQAQQHDGEVVRTINYYLDLAYDGMLNIRVNRTLAKQDATVAAVLDRAQNRCMQERAGPDDLVRRDAEYYLKMRLRTAAHKFSLWDAQVGTTRECQAAIDIILNITYNTLKGAGQAVGVGWVFESDKGETAPSGVSVGTPNIWGYRRGYRSPARGIVPGRKEATPWTIPSCSPSS
jgi:hypothetical protein